MEIINLNAKPFLKWAGGKGKMISDISQRLPSLEEYVYVEPFIGGGALLFWILQNSKVKRAIINDINLDVISCYKMIKNNHLELIKKLSIIEEEFHKIDNIVDKTSFFNDKRITFNNKVNMSEIDNATLMIFLNKTCFNGLYRVNKKNEFNVPFNKGMKPTICDAENINNCNKILQNVTILNGDYSETIKYIEDDKFFFYFDPPYKPISETSSFNSYNKESFEDNEQVKLRDYCSLLDKMSCKWLLSNSDLKNYDIDNDYFDDLYKNYNIQRIKSKRMINSKGSGRGEINEILVSNY
jgi:DNA adenine methylase